MQTALTRLLGNWLQVNSSPDRPECEPSPRCHLNCRSGLRADDEQSENAPKMPSVTLSGG